MLIRTSKIFINDAETFIGDGPSQYADTISGSLFNNYQDSEVSGDCVQTQYYLNTARPLSNQLYDWQDRFLGSLKSFRNHAALCKDTKVATGNIIESINNGKGTKFKGCFIALFDKNKILFEVHYNAMKLFYVDDVIMAERSTYNQLQTDLMVLKTGSTDPNNVFAQLDELKEVTHRRAGSKLTLQDEEDILHFLTMGTKANSQRNIAARYSVSQQTISKLKKQFIEKGLL